jgi:hypothetical protein
MLFLISLGILIILLANIADNLWPPSSAPALQSVRASEVSELEDVTIVPKVTLENDRQRVREKRAKKQAVAAARS